MNIFNSLGSNYSPRFVLSSIYQSDSKGRKKLTSLLENKYQKHALLFYKGRSAITQALKEANLEKNSAVAINGFTCIAVVNAIKKADCIPVFLDINNTTLNFDTKTLEEHIKIGKIKAVIIQNTLGFPCDIEGISKVCKKNNLILIEDLAHSIGTVYENGKEAGSIGDFAILSFSQDKVIDAVSGGALLSKRLPQFYKKDPYASKDPSFQDKLYPLSTFLIRKTYKSGVGKFLHACLKYTHLLSNPMKNNVFKDMSDWHATLAVNEFEMLEAQIQHRHKIANIYKKHIDTRIQFKGVSSSVENSTCLRFPLKISERLEFFAFAKKKGLYISDTWYDSPIAPNKFLDNSSYKAGECKNSENISQQIINLPTHINVSENDALLISEIINTWNTKQK